MTISPVEVSRNAAHEAVCATFLGPLAENNQDLKRFFGLIVDDVAKARKDYFPNDKPFITEEAMSSYAFKARMGQLEATLKDLSALLAKHSVPFWSPRYAAHMTSDTTMPGMLGYLVTMMYNPNNVASEASPLTTYLEWEVGQQLCAMLGYNTAHDEGPKGWGHVTCDGSVANLESMWAARNLKFYPLSLKNAVAVNAPLAFISPTFQVKLCTGVTKLLKDCTTWELLNLDPATILDLQPRLSSEYGLSTTYVESVMRPYIVQTIGRSKLETQYGITQSPQYLVSTTKHYSWPKSAAIVGIGSDSLIEVSIDNSARMDADVLDKLLAERLEKKQAVYAVVAVIGTTEHGAVDPISKILALRTKYQALGLSFLVHADGAWGGYFTSMLREPFTFGGGKDEDIYVPSLALLPYTKTQLEHLGSADSITIDPHKSGYIPYPAGALCYRDGRMRYQVTWTSPVLGEPAEAGMGAYGVEGSKPGASPMAAWVSHEVIGLHKHGYGSMLGEALFSGVKMYSQWTTMSMNHPTLVVVPLIMLPSEVAGGTPAEIEAEKIFIRDFIVNKTNLEIIENPASLKKVQEIGGDLMINAFACNFRINGVVNQDIIEANYLNRRLYSRMSIQKRDDVVADRPIIIMSTEFSQAKYGPCLTNFKRRLGLVGDQDLFALSNLSMSPFATSGSFTRELAAAFQKIAEEEIALVVARNTVSPVLHAWIMQGTEELYLSHLPMFNVANHRHQLIFSAELPASIKATYIKVRKADPSATLLLATAGPETLEGILKNGHFKAELVNFKDGKPFTDPFDFTTFAVVKHKKLASKDLLPSYPRKMPFYLYGSLDEPHVDHMLLHSPNVVLTGSLSKLEVALDKSLDSIPRLNRDLKTGLIALMDTVPEHAMQPFNTLHEPTFFKDGGKFPVTIYYDSPNPTLVDGVPVGAFYTTGWVTLGPNVFTDYHDVNMDRDMGPPASQSRSVTSASTAHDVAVGSWGSLEHQLAVRKGWKEEISSVLSK